MDTTSSSEPKTTQAPTAENHAGGGGLKRKVFELPEAPSPVAETYRLLGLYGTVTLAAGLLFFIWVMGGTRRTEAALLCLGMVMWGLLSLVAAYSIVRRRSWSRAMSRFCVVAFWPLVVAVLAVGCLAMASNILAVLGFLLFVGFALYRLGVVLSRHAFTYEWESWVAIQTGVMKPPDKDNQHIV